ncbi:MAG: AAA family ATPase [Oscillospiraceae bacterium]|nr:AAA family ATPase [Oscillospiraceae bacterium]
MPFIVGIAGGSASGKTTFCHALAETLDGYNINVFHMDHYFKADEQLPRAKAPIADKEYPDHNHPDTIDFPRLLDAISQTKQSTEIILIEGALAFAFKEIYSQCDLKIYIDCQVDERIVRRLKRYYSGAWGNVTVDEIFGYMSDIYLDLVRYRHDEYVEPSKWRADMILNGSMPSEKALEMVRDYILSKIGGAV